MVVATLRVRRGCSVETGSGDAADATRIFSGERFAAPPRCDVDSVEKGATWIFGGEWSWLHRGCDVDIP